MKQHDKSRPVWFITGSSTGFGLSIAEAALESGANVFITGLSEGDKAGLQHLPADRYGYAVVDVRNTAQLQAAVADCMTSFGRVDVLVNNAGYGMLGAAEEVSAEEYRNLFDVNFFGAAEATRAVLPHMRKARQGHIVNISSMAGFTGAAGFSFYAASKFALEGYSEALARESAALGIRVTIVEPAALRTNFRGASMARAVTVIEDYESTSGVARKNMDRLHGKQSGDPRRAARVIVDAVLSGSAPLRLPLGRDTIDRVRAKLAEVEKEIVAWETRALDIDFPAGQ